MLILWILILIISLIVIVKSADFFTSASEKLGEILKLNKFFIGITVVALATSLPELAISILAVSDSYTEIVIGNVVGSNIFNLLVIGGMAFILCKNFVIKNKLSLWYVIISTAFIVLTSIFWDEQSFQWIEGAVGIGIFIAYMLFIQIKRQDRDFLENFDFKRPPLFMERTHGQGKSLGIIMVSLVMIYVGAWATIQSIINISEILDVAKDTIAITAIAIGTSLPELLVTLSAVKRKSYDLIIGNIAGSSMINVFLVMGIPSLIKPLFIPLPVIEVALPFLLVSTLLIAIFGLIRQTKRWVGLIFLLLYVLFILFI